MKARTRVTVTCVTLNATPFLPVGGGLFAITLAGKEMMSEVDKGLPVTVLNKDGEVIAITDRNDYQYTSLGTAGCGLLHLREGGKLLLEAYSSGFAKMDCRLLKSSHKHLTRNGWVIGFSGLGIADFRLKDDQVGISQELADRLGIQNGEHMGLTRIPQGSGSAAIVNVTVVICRGMSGIAVNAWLALLLGGDVDSDRYYLLQMLMAAVTLVEQLGILTVQELLMGAENPSMLKNLPKHKLSYGWDDLAKEAERSAVGPLTAMGYLICQLGLGRLGKDQYWPAQELIFDLRKLDGLGINVSERMGQIMALPLRHRYQGLVHFAKEVVHYLSTTTHELEDYYMVAFKNLAYASVKGNSLVHQFLGAVSRFYNHETLTMEDRIWLKYIPFIEPKAIPDFEEVGNLLRGKPCKWRGIHGAIKHLISENQGEDEPIIKPESVLGKLFGDHFEHDVRLYVPDTSIIKGTKKSLLALMWLKDGMELVRRFQYDGETKQKVVLRLQFDTTATEHCGVPTVSGKLLTGVLYVANHHSKVVNAMVDEGVYNPFKWFIRCLEVALDEQFGGNPHLLSGEGLHFRMEDDLRIAAYSARRIWLSKATTAKSGEALAFQMKAINLGAKVSAELQAKVNSMIGDEWEFRSTKNSRKGYIMPDPSTELFVNAMDMWYHTGRYSALLPINRVTREQLVTNHVGTGFIRVLVFDKANYTFSQCASSYDALQRFLGNDYNNKKRSASDGAVLFNTLPFRKNKAVQVEGIKQLVIEYNKAIDDGWDVVFEDNSYELHDDQAKVRSITDLGNPTTKILSYTLRLTKDLVMNPDHSYKLMVGPGAKGMYRILPSKVEALVNGEMISIQGAISGLSLQGKNALSAVYTGSERLLGVELPAEAEAHVAAHMANGSDDEARYPAFVDGQFVGYYTVLDVPYWVLPASTEDSGQQAGSMPWVAPLASEFADSFQITSPMTNKLRYAKAALAVIARDIRSLYVKGCEDTGVPIDPREIGRRQLSEIERLFGSIFTHTVTTNNEFTLPTIEDDMPTEEEQLDSLFEEGWELNLDF